MYGEPSVWYPMSKTFTTFGWVILATALASRASRFEAADRGGRPTALLPDELAYALFFDNSTPTKSAAALSQCMENCRLLRSVNPFTRTGTTTSSDGPPFVEPTMNCTR